MKKIPKGFGIPFTNKNLPMPGDPLNFDFDEHSEFFKHLMRLKMKMAGMSDEERTSPDTFGCDSIFLEHFVTIQMSDDFSLIARDFLLHEFQNVREHEMVRFLEPDSRTDWPERMFHKYVLNMMMNAVNYGSVYTKNLFLYLYKTYYRKEYQQIKRFSKLSIGELMGLATNDRGEISHIAFARILAISKMYGIDISPECDFIYLFLNDLHERHIFEPDWGFMDEMADLYAEGMNEVEKYFESEEEMYDLRYKYETFIETVLRSEGYTEDYVMLCNESDNGIEDRLARTINILKRIYKDKQFTKDEIMMFASIMEAVDALMSVADDVDNKLNDVIYGEKSTDYYEEYPPLFKAEEVMKGKSEPAKQIRPVKEKTPAENEQPDSPKYKEETLIADIDTLHRKIHEQEGNIKVLRGEIAEYRKLAEENRKLKEQLDSDRKELVALREHVYSLTENDEADTTVSVDEMKEYLNSLRVIIVGGHSNWRQKMKQEFKDWVYIEPSVSGTLEASVVDKADYVYFFTDTISHSTYFKYMNIVKEHGVDFGYIHGVNIDNTIRKMYKELAK